MDLEQIENVEQTVNYADVDAVEVGVDVEDLTELEHDVESSLNTVAGLIEMEETFDVVEVGDQESVTDRQLTAFRASMQTTMIAANGNLKTSFGIDTEATYVDATTEYAKDVEGIKEFFKKIWEKIKKGLIKANAFFRKMFLKFINMVSFRKGTIEKLQEDVGAASTGNETLKASKFGIVKKLAAVASLKGGLSGDKITMSKDINEAMYEGTNGTILASISKVMKDALVVAKAAAGGDKVDPVALEEGNADAFSEFKDTDGMKALEKVDTASMKKFKKSKAFGTVRASGSKIYVFGITEKYNLETGTISIKADKVKTLEGLTSALVLEGLKSAEKTNEDFKEIVNSAFEAYDDAESIAEVFTDVKLPDDADEDANKALKRVEKIGKSLSAKTPWIAFHTSMGAYKSVGYSIDLAKAYLKDVKDDKDDK